MNNNPKSYNFQELLAGYVLGDLDENELAWLNQQLVANPQLEEEIKQIQETLALMPYGLSSEKPSNDLRNNILASVSQKYKKYKKSTISPFQRNKLSWLIVAITTLTTILFGFNNYQLRQQLSLKETELLQQQELTALLRQPNNRLMALKGVETSTTSGSLFIIPEEKKAILVLQNLASLPEDKVYRLWAVSQGKKTGCIHFKPDEKGGVAVELSPQELTDAQSVLITVESQPDSFQPTSKPVITSSQSI